jgi:curved DNA-binding protein CbpA
MQEEKDYYAILGISRSSNEDEIKRAYFELINKFSTPDANPSEKEKVRQISEAYNILSNSEKKKNYDWDSRFKMNEIEMKFYEAASKLIPNLKAQHEVKTSLGKTYRLDFAKIYNIGLYDKIIRKIAIEIDGHEYHKTKEQRTYDAEKELDLKLDGWEVIRFTGTQIHNNLDQCVDVTVKLMDQNIKEFYEEKSKFVGSDMPSLRENNYRFSRIMTEEIISKLNGSSQEFLRLEIPDKPSKIIILGTLGDSSKDFSSEEEKERTLTSVKNNSMSVRFLIKEKYGSFRVKPSLSLYYRVYPSWEEEQDYSRKYYEDGKKIELAKVWKRFDCEFDVPSFNLSNLSSEYSLSFDPFIDIIKKDKKIFKTGKEIDFEIINDKTSYEKTIEEISIGNAPNLEWNGKILVHAEEFTQNDENFNLITISIVNTTQKSNQYETFFFNCKFNIDLNNINIIPFRYEYMYEENRYYYENYLRCLNCHANYDENTKKITTKHYGGFCQEKLAPKVSIESFSLSFSDLSSDNLLNVLKKLESLMQLYIKKYKESEKYNSDLRYRSNADHFERIRERFLDGLNELETNENAFKAFALMNKTFVFSSKFDKWRIFQIVFIVSLLPDIIDKTERRDICDLLHVHTGGGKTETYLGCVLFSAFYDRLVGKKFGTTAITKFPLRMLSIQQLQRIAQLFIWAEDIRKSEGLGGEPFSVAYFVGATEEYPRHTKSLIIKLEKNKIHGKEEKGKIVEICPICGGNVILSYKPERYIIHFCKECKREFRLFYTTEEIFRFLPTLIVSTVDKFAGIALNRRFKNIFGGKLDECLNGHGFIPRNDICDNVGLNSRDECKSIGKPVHNDFETGPNLIIQDEMHLIREGFGTIDSHFESMIEALQYELTGCRFKNIAMTATTTGAKEQIEHLYNKEINVFPGESPNGRGINDFFFDYEMEENQKGIQRIFIGLKPNLRDNQFASLITLKYVSEFIKKVESDIEGFSYKYNFQLDKLNSILENYKIILTYHNKKSDVHSMNYYLEAVVNSKLENYKFIPKILTGDSSLDDIKDLINLADKFYENKQNKERLISVFATSIVSHGIDIEKWNFMIFQGMPRSTAEYIQAMSRVGRKFSGVVFIWFYPNRARDLSFYQNFEDYHEIIEQKVENVPLSRWAKLGFKQTFTSIFNASILNYMSDILEQPIYNVEKVNQIFSNEMNKKKLIEFILKAYIADSPAPGASYFRKEIQRETEERLSYLKTYTGGEIHFFPNALKDCDQKYYKTQYGMRGIQDVVILKPTDADLYKYKKLLEG